MHQLTSADLCYVNKVSAGRMSSPILGTNVSRDPGRYTSLFIFGRRTDITALLYWRSLKTTYKNPLLLTKLALDLLSFPLSLYQSYSFLILHSTFCARKLRLKIMISFMCRLPPSSIYSWFINPLSLSFKVHIS